MWDFRATHVKKDSLFRQRQKDDQFFKHTYNSNGYLLCIDIKVMLNSGIRDWEQPVIFLLCLSFLIPNEASYMNSNWCHSLLRCLTFSSSLRKIKLINKANEIDSNTIISCMKCRSVSLRRDVIMCERPSAAVSCPFERTMLSATRMFNIFQVLFETINWKKTILLLSHISADRIVCNMINLHWNQR